MSTDAPAAAPEGMVLCSCCGEAVPAVHAVRHVAFCERNNKKCVTCGKTLRKVGLLCGFDSYCVPIMVITTVHISLTNADCRASSL